MDGKLKQMGLLLWYTCTDHYSIQIKVQEDMELQPWKPDIYARSLSMYAYKVRVPIIMYNINTTEHQCHTRVIIILWKMGSLLTVYIYLDASHTSVAQAFGSFRKLGWVSTFFVVAPIPIPPVRYGGMSTTSHSTMKETYLCLLALWIPVSSTCGVYLQSPTRPPDHTSQRSFAISATSVIMKTEEQLYIIIP